MAKKTVAEHHEEIVKEWIKIYRTMTNKRVGCKLTDSDRRFLEGINLQLDKGRYPTIDQIDAIEKINRTY
jgi:hypothetical protein